MMADWHPDIQLGLLVYGHRGRRASGGPCKDIQVVQSVGYDKAGAVKQALEAVTAVDTAPLCAALKHLEAKSRPGNLVLMSDGTKECGGDEEEAVQWLAAAYPALTTHVNSLDQSELDNASLVALTKNTKGHFLNITRANQTTRKRF